MRKTQFSYEKLYKVWTSMRARCNAKKSKAYPNYGGRGIRVCDEWNESYFPFRAWAYQNGYREGLSIDRIDNDGWYSPENCRWVTRVVQQNNTRKNRPITICGETHNFREWSRIIGISCGALSKRLNKGLSGEALKATPNKKYKTIRKEKRNGRQKERHNRGRQEDVSSPAGH